MTGFRNLHKGKFDSCFTVYLKFLLNEDVQCYTKCLWRTVRITCKGNTSTKKKIIPRKQWVPAATSVWGAGCQEDTRAGHGHPDKPLSRRAWAQGTELRASSKSINNPDTFRGQWARAGSMQQGPFRKRQTWGWRLAPLRHCWSSD